MGDKRILEAAQANSVIDLESNLVYGAIIGIATLVDSHPSAGCCLPWGESEYVEHGAGAAARSSISCWKTLDFLQSPSPAAGHWDCGTCRQTSREAASSRSRLTHLRGTG